MLKALTLSNFKGISKTQEIRLAPLTLLFGANSSGKTSVLQSLLLLKQTIEEAESRDTVLLPRGRLIDLGNYKELIHDHESSRELSIGMRFDRGKSRMPADYSVSSEELSDDAWSTLTFGGRGREIRLRRYEVGVGGWDNKLAGFVCRRSKSRISNDSMDSDSRSLLLHLDYLNLTHRYIEDQWSLGERDISAALRSLSQLVTRGESRQVALGHEPDPKNVRTRSDDLERLLALEKKYANYSVAAFAKDVEQVTKARVFELNHFLPGRPFARRSTILPEYDFIEQRFPFRLRHWHNCVSKFTSRTGADVWGLLEQLIYLGPLREYPERHYIYSGNIVTNVGKSGRFMADLLFRDDEVVATLNEWLDRFGIGYRLSVKTLRDPEIKDLFAIRLREAGSDITVSPSDVGFGISQILPILVQSIVSKNRTIIVEQPEIHLHPRLQAEIGSFLADCASSGNRNQFLVETHSEHIILRLQKLVREGKLSVDAISVVYVQKTSDGAICHDLRLDDNGDFIDDWPDGFFPERLEELL